MNGLMRRRLMMLQKQSDAPWLDYPTLTYDQSDLICSDGTHWTWNSGGYWEYASTVEPKMIKAWFQETSGTGQNLFSNNSSSYECWQNGTSFNFRSKGNVYRTLKANDLYPITFDFVTDQITRSDGTVITAIPSTWLPFQLSCIAGRAGASNNNQYLYGIQVWL